MPLLLLAQQQVAWSSASTDRFTDEHRAEASSTDEHHHFTPATGTTTAPPELLPLTLRGVVEGHSPTTANRAPAITIVTLLAHKASTAAFARASSASAGKSQRFTRVRTASTSTGGMTVRTALCARSIVPVISPFF